MDLIDQIDGKKILITGGSGFIGSHLCSRLVACGAKVHAISRTRRRQVDEYPYWWQANCSDVSAVRQVFKSVQPEIVFHLAGHVDGAREVGQVLPTFYNNLACTVHLLTVASEIGCDRIVLASSSEEPRNSEGLTFASSPYAAAKWASNMYGNMFHQLFRLPIVMPRIFMTYGPDQKDARKLVPFVVQCLLRGEAPALTSGRRQADWIFVEDVVEGLLRAAVSPDVIGATFDLGSGSLSSVRTVVDQIVEILSTGVKPVFGTLPERPFEQERAADISFMSKKLGYQPRTSLKQGLEMTVDWYSKNFQLDREV